MKKANPSHPLRLVIQESSVVIRCGAGKCRSCEYEFEVKKKKSDTSRQLSGGLSLIPMALFSSSKTFLTIVSAKASCPRAAHTLCVPEIIPN